jgi:F-type H+-transporting ATPase subunit delta
MTEYRVALRYAKSLLALAKDEKVLEKIKDDMLLFQETIKVSGPFRALLRNPEVQGDKKLKVLKALFEKKVHKITLSFFEIIIRKRREKHLDDIAQQFHSLYNQDQGIQETHITTTFSLSNDLKEEFSRVAGEISGKKPELVEHVDEEILGGFVLKVADRQLDSSIRTKLNELRVKLTK